MSSEVNPQPSSPLQSAGVVLSNERIKRGISIQEVADQIKLSRKQIEAIEADDMSTGTERPETRGEAVKEDVDRRRRQLRVVNGGA